MKTQSNMTRAGLAALALTALGGLKADMVVTTAEGVGSFNTTLGGVNVETFDNLNTGLSKNVSWSGVGSFDQLNILPADQYGGAPTAASPKGSQYAVEGLSGKNSVATTTLTLNSASSYFGMYWSAGDGANDLKFYNGNTLVAEFSTQTLMDNLPKSYYGNPITSGSNAGKDSGEPFGFINFLGDAKTSWTSIVFSNGSNGSGFEGDNYTSRVNGWSPTTDGNLPGEIAVAEVNNGQTTSLGNVSTASGNALPAGFVPAAPGAPAPPMTACLAFAGVLLLQTFRRTKFAQ